MQPYRTIPHRSAHSLTNNLYFYQDLAQRLSCIFLLLFTLLLPQWSAWNQEAKKETLHKITLTGLCIGVRRTKGIIISSLAEMSSATDTISRFSIHYTPCEVLSHASAISFPAWPRNPDHYPRAPSSLLMILPNESLFSGVWLPRCTWPLRWPYIILDPLLFPIEVGVPRLVLGS